MLRRLPSFQASLPNTNQVPWEDSRDRSVAATADARVERSRLTHLCLPEDRVANQYRDRLCCSLAELKSRVQSSALRQSDDREEIQTSPCDDLCRISSRVRCELSCIFSSESSWSDDADVSKDFAKLISIPTEKVLLLPAFPCAEFRRFYSALTTTQRRS